MTTITIRKATPSDGAGVAAIYNHYIEHTIVTFEEEPVTNEQMSSRIEKTLRDYPWLVLLDGERVIGYANAGRWHQRAAYRHSVESAIYLAHDRVGHGHGSALYSALFAELTKHPVHVIIAGISLPNAASVSFHEKFGFKKAAHYAEVGRKFDKWVDVGYWQKTDITAFSD